MEIVGLRGDRVRLVPPDATLHLENALRWFNDPEITALLDLYWGVGRRQEVAFFERIEIQGEPDFNWALLDENDRHIGFIALQKIDWKMRCASGGLAIGERDAWGRGYATDAVRTRTRFAFDQLNLHRVEGQTMNAAMRRVYEKCGYRHEGTTRKKRWRHGRWLDTELYAILDEDYAIASRPPQDRLESVMPADPLLYCRTQQ
jgi:RimJ/RimL family protein N-acetyltransferase